LKYDNSFLETEKILRVSSPTKLVHSPNSNLKSEAQFQSHRHSGKTASIKGVRQLFLLESLGQRRKDKNSRRFSLAGMCFNWRRSFKFRSVLWHCWWRHEGHLAC